MKCSEETRGDKTTGGVYPSFFSFFHSSNAQPQIEFGVLKLVKWQVCSHKQCYATNLQMTHRLLKTLACKMQLLVQCGTYFTKITYNSSELDLFYRTHSRCFFQSLYIICKSALQVH